MQQAHNHCHWCGTEYAELVWPRKCSACLKDHFRNPTPVAVALLPVKDWDGKVGLLFVRRNIPPIGKLALPGGYIDFGEDWKDGCVRELFEETGVVARASNISLYDVKSAPNTIIIYGLLPLVERYELPPFVPNAETQEVLVYTYPVPLAFPLHEEMAERFFKEQEDDDT